MNTCSLRSTYARSLSDRAVIYPGGSGYEPARLHGFSRHDGGGGNRTRVQRHWRGSAPGSEPLDGLVARTGVRIVRAYVRDHTRGEA